MPDPLVSIGIPTWNYGHFLGEAIESALAQSYENIEVIVSDNASTDNTPDIVASFRDPRVKYFRNPDNFGVFRNWNRCMQEAKGKFFKILQADDKIDPTFVTYCLQIFEHYPEAVLVATGYNRFGAAKGRTCWPFDRETISLDGNCYWDSMFELPNMVQPICQLINLSWMKSTQGYSVKFTMSSDYHFWLKSALQSKVVICEPALAWERIHASQVRSHRDNTPILDDMFNIYQEILPIAKNKELAKRQVHKHMQQFCHPYIRKGIKFALHGNFEYLRQVIEILEHNHFLWPGLVSFVAGLPEYVLSPYRRAQ
jgi:glycosyltransferase involved in cell wall biosynthesis